MVDDSDTPRRPEEWLGFQDLNRRRIEEILLVSSLYDSFILAEDGQINERLLRESLDLHLRHIPSITRVSTGAEALARAADGRFQLVITSLHVGDMGALALARRLKDWGFPAPVVLLAYDARELADFLEHNDAADLDGVYLWQGDVRILLAMVQAIEDRWNVEHDSGVAGVQVILVVEDSPRFYSAFLPTIYSELAAHSQSLVPDGLNLSHKLLRLQARPKILHCRSYEEAWELFSAYRENVLGVITDVEFPHAGALDPEAGLALARAVRALQPDVPVMLQSSRKENEAPAEALGATFLLKGSPVLLHELRRMIEEQFGFGDFVFRLPDGSEVARAGDLKTLEEMLWTVPAESIAYHGERNHFSTWLKARTEFALARGLRPRKVEDFATHEDLRRDLIRAIQEYRTARSRRVVSDFDGATFDGTVALARIGSGSLGGKARGLAFVNHLLFGEEIRRRFPGMTIAIPQAVVLATDVFDRFLEENDLRDFAIECGDDDEILRRFAAVELPLETVRDLGFFLHVMRQPLAVRSSSLLEDSQYQPFAGVYETYMLANNQASHHLRLTQLKAAIKRVWASAFSQRAKAFLEATPYRLEEERMAVILQRIVGSAHGGRFYPSVAGVARSHNFYPVAPITPEDGIAAVALGFGESVVDGDACVRFCPRYPRHLVQFSSVREVRRNSQREFYALPVAEIGASGALGEGGADPFALRRYGLDVAEADGTLAPVGSTVSSENDAVYDGISRPGVRLVSFAPILKHGVFPLAEILDHLLEVAKDATSGPVEIEFAVNLSTPEGVPPEFGFLQLRPLALSREPEELEIGPVPDGALVCRSASVMGNGLIDGIRDLVVVDAGHFDRSRSRVAAAEIAEMNAMLSRERLPYLLIGVGRWGSADPHLGIPVGWDQISGARVIVETGFADFRVTPSQGTHFFQNLVASQVGYFTVNPDQGDGYLDWDWIRAQPAEEERTFVRRIRLSAPLGVTMNGRRSEGVIVKPR